MWRAGDSPSSLSLGYAIVATHIYYAKWNVRDGTCSNDDIFSYADLLINNKKE